MISPRLTAVLVSRTGLRESGPVLENLLGQTLARDLEVILVAPRGIVSVGDLAGFGGFESIRLLELERVVNRGEAAAHGLLLARAPFASPRENHSFPSPDALERVIQDWHPDDAAVAPTVRSANPETRRSLAMYLAAYGPAAAPADPAPRDTLPHHNAIFRSDLLREIGDRLPELMSDENRLHAELQRRGFRLRLRPDAVIWHVNEARWSRAVTDPFMLGLAFGASRGVQWPLAKRLLGALGAPIIAVRRLKGLVQLGRRAEDTRHRIWWLAPMLGLTALMAALGEAWGYLRPGTPIPDHVEAHEFHLRGRLAGVLPASPWLRDIVARLPADLE